MVIVLRGSPFHTPRERRAEDGFKLRLGLSDGTERGGGCSPYLGGPVFEALQRNAAPVAVARVDEILGTSSGPNGADSCPDVPPAASQRVSVGRAPSVISRLSSRPSRRTTAVTTSPGLWSASAYV